MNINYRVNTYNAFSSLPRITEFFHSSVSNPNYYFCGKYRQNSNHCIFHYTLKGCGETWIDDTIYKTSPGIGFLNIINNENAGYRYPIDGIGEWEFIVLCFEYGNARNIVSEIIENYGPLFKIDLHSDFITDISNGNILNPNITLSTLDAHVIFSKLISALLQSCETFLTKDSPYIIKKTQAIISKRIIENISINEIAIELNISREYLSRLFRQYTGKSLKSFITKQKLNYICNILKNTSLSVDRIAEKMNFSSTSNFIMFFKKHTGLTPKQFRLFGTEPI